VAHEVLVGVTEQVVALGAVGAEVEGGLSKMDTRLVRRSTISFPLPSLSASLKSATSMTPLRSLASASLAMILFILSPISLSPLRTTMSAKLPPFGTSSG